MRRALAVAAAAALLGGCLDQASHKPSEALFVGIDVSGSFQRSPYFKDSLQFLSQYIYARLNGKGDLQPAKTLFVGSIGGKVTEENKSFYPIEDFQGKTPDQIQADLEERFPQSDKLTDFSIFFRQVADIAHKRNLSLSPITLVLLTDGIPDVVGLSSAPENPALFSSIDLSSLEYLSRKVTVRMLYASPVVASKWETAIARQRVRMWTVDHQVMTGWKAQFDPAKTPDQQDRLWKWIVDNVDFRVRPLTTHLGGAAAANRKS